MERVLQTEDPTYDFRRYDRIWQRVAPNLSPYPGFSGPAVPAMAEQRPPEEQTPPAEPPQTPENQLPGAEMDPCCMGSAAEEMLNVVTGFLETELSDQRYYQAFARQVPAWLRPLLRELAASAGAHAARLSAVHYLITGQCYRPSVSCERIFVGRWCPALRERYHAEACNGLNYARAAEETTDPCLSELLRELSQEDYGHARRLLAALERAL